MSRNTDTAWNNGILLFTSAFGQQRSQWFMLIVYMCVYTQRNYTKANQNLMKYCLAFLCSLPVTSTLFYST